MDTPQGAGPEVGRTASYPALMGKAHYDVDVNLGVQKMAG